MTPAVGCGGLRRLPRLAGRERRSACEAAGDPARRAAEAPQSTTSIGKGAGGVVGAAWLRERLCESGVGLG